MINDNELIQIFLSEARDILDSINHQIDQLRAQPLLKDPWIIILRELHTLKGSARMLDLLDLNAYAHLLEELIQKFCQIKLPDDNEMRALQEALDYINFYIDELSKGNILATNENFFVQLKKIIRTDEQSAPSLTDKEKKEIATNATEKDTAGLGVVRVKGDVLEQLSELATKISVARSQAEQQIKTTQQFLLEMDKKIQVTTEVLRQLQLNIDLSTGVKLTHEWEVIELEKHSLAQQSIQTLEDSLNEIKFLNTTIINSIKNATELFIDQKRLTRNLEEGLTRTKLISIENLIPRFQRVVRQVASELGKKVNLHCVKVEGQIDRNILEKLIPSLEHMLRNAIDHGIEMPDERLKLHKNEWGTIALALIRQGNEICIQLRDDGEGIDINKIHNKAIALDLWPKDVPMSEQEAFQFIILTGFSTKETLSPISGQGVGLDVVNAAVTKLGGSLQIESKPSVGTCFTIKLPFTLSLNQALVFTVAQQMYALQLTNLMGLKHLSIEEFKKIREEKQAEVSYGAVKYRLFFLAKILGEKPNSPTTTTHLIPVIFLRTERASIGLIVDKLMGSWEMVIKPPGPQLQYLKHIAGLTVFSDNQIAFVLNAATLVESALAFSENTHNKPKHIKPLQKIKILVVDDSVTIRHHLNQLFKRHGFLPFTAKNAEEGFRLIKEVAPDIILLDIEMPEISGYQLLEQLRATKEYRHLPVIMLTSCADKDDQRKAFALGASAYLTKPYIDEELISLVRNFHKK